MDTIFSGLMLDMVALESAVDAYEWENELTPSYLSSDVSYDAIAEESIATESTSDDEFGSFGFAAGLFEETVATEASETETADKPKGSFGAKLKNGIKSVLSAIANFFKGIGEKIKGIIAKIKSKSAEAKAAAAKANAPQTVVDHAKEVHNAVQKAIDIIDNSITADAQRMNAICKKINDAIKNAGMNNHTGAVTNDDLEKVGTAYAGINDKAGNGDGKKAGTWGKDKDARIAGNDSEIADAEEIIKRCDEAEGRMKAAVENIKSTYIAFIKKVVVDAVDVKEDKRDDETKKNDREAAEKEYNQMAKDEGWGSTNKKAKPENQAPSIHQTGKNGKSSLMSEGKITEQSCKNYLHLAFYSQSGLIDKAKKACEDIQTECNKNIQFCQQGASLANAINSDNENTKRGYKLCKIYMDASRIFGNISTYITGILGGSYYSSGNKGQDQKYSGSITTKNPPKSKS